jgi:hypothetical protein
LASAPPKPFGASILNLAVGPFHMRLEGLSADQVRVMRQRYGSFLLAARTGTDVCVSLTQARVDGFLEARIDGVPEIYRLKSRARGSRRMLWSYEFAGWVDPSRRQAFVALVQPGGERFERGLENFLRVLTASFVLERGGFLLHGAAVVRGGRAHVFFGPSGSGKTTVTHLSPYDTVLSDDLTLVIRGERGYEAAGIPFGMAHHRIPDTRGSFPIASFYRLVKSQSVRRERLHGARAVAEIAGSLPFVMEEKRQAARAIESVGCAIRDVPVYRLEFRRDDGFWDVVAREN